MFLCIEMYFVTKYAFYEQSEDISAIPHNFKGLFRVQVLRLALALGQVQGEGCDPGVRVRGWRIHYIYEGLQSDQSTRLCVLQTVIALFRVENI